MALSGTVRGPNSSLDFRAPREHLAGSCTTANRHAGATKAESWPHAIIVLSRGKTPAPVERDCGPPTLGGRGSCLAQPGCRETARLLSWWRPRWYKCWALAPKYLLSVAKVGSLQTPD